ncbi:hypothetical protein AXG93_2584s1000 [Marchantia polymorpha subsp. ruderalis]|uniref:Uncharacterized protein n=1 Tax=Marchantia polymorpha subsp. ruderalis TaxID=1480154 RepID=A0A176VJS2_MARPO|nr:hypothetical protein AXG93_2584s1000 [Marchantia polymorpha subsp. ruderalis]
MQRRTCFGKGVEVTSAKNLWTSTIASWALQRKCLQQRNFGEVKGGAKRKENSNSCEDGDYTYDSKSVKVIQAEEKSFAKLFKKPRSGKNEWQTTEYRNRLRRMGLLTVVEQESFPLKRKIADDEGVLGGNEVASEEDNIEPAPPSAEADKS